MRVPDYVLCENHSVQKSSDEWDLAAGTFVKPIQPQYLPQHIKESKDFKNMLLLGWIYCYTPKGIYPIPKSKIRRVDG